MSEVDKEVALDAYSVKLTAAIRNFESMQKLIDKTWRVVDTSGNVNALAGLELVHALAMQFVFEVVRLNRIVKHRSAELNIDREVRKSFTAFVSEKTIMVRDVNEHSSDHNAKQKSKRKYHNHYYGGISLDETSIIVLGRTEILMGPLNLHSVYLELRKLANNCAPWSHTGQRRQTPQS